MCLKSTVLAFCLLAPISALAQPAPPDCKGLPSHEELKKAVTAARQAKNGGMSNDMWGAVVGRTGKVCAVVYTGKDINSQWIGSRLIAAEKANTANAFALPQQALSTANLFAATQSGGFMAGVADSHPVHQPVAYKGPAAEYGLPKDPLVGEALGGVITFGGGLALYDQTGSLVGGLGVSGDTSCADHNIAWRTRSALSLDFVPGGVAKDQTDQIIYDIKLGRSSSGFGHPDCGKGEDKIVKDLPKVRKVSAK